MADHLSDFLSALDTAGLPAVSSKDIYHTGGAWKAYQTLGDKGKTKSCGFRLTINADGAVGQYRSYKDSEIYTWHSKAKENETKEEQAARMKRREADKAAYDKKQAEDYAKAATDARTEWKASLPAIEHPYLKKKGIQAHGARINAEGLLILKVCDIAGKPHSLQRIDKTGKDKRFMFGGKTEGCFYLIAEKGDDANLIFICEGFATGASIREATGKPVVVAFTAGNLMAVAKVWRKKSPDASIIIAADSDIFTFKNPRPADVKDIDRDNVAGDDIRWAEWREKDYMHNTGVESAQAAAHKINARVMWPEFSPADIKDKPTDWNDYHKLYGLDALKTRLSAVPVEEERAFDVLPINAYEGDIQGSDNSMLWMDLCEFKDRRSGTLNKDFALHNSSVLLSHKEPISGCFVYDEFLNKETVIKPLPWDTAKDFEVREVDSNDVVRSQIWLECEGVRLGKAVVNDIIKLACQNRKINPAEDYLRGLIWDKKPRLNTWLIRAMGAIHQPSDYVEKVGACWLIAGALRILFPGTPFHHMLVLEGGQGALKSTSLATLATFGKDSPRTYFSDRITFDMIDRADFAVHADGNVILEFQELSGMGKKDRNKVKQWITLSADEFRKPYDPLPTKFPRKFILAGTTNDMQYLNDPTGDRRFWPVKVGDVNIKLLKEEREQLWAEAVYRALNGEKHYIEPDDPIYRLMQSEQSARYSGDAWDDCVSQYVEDKSCVTVDQIFSELLMIERGRWNKFDRDRITTILTRLGFETVVQWDSSAKKTVRKWGRVVKDITRDVEELPFD